MPTSQTSTIPSKQPNDVLQDSRKTKTIEPQNTWKEIVNVRVEINEIQTKKN